MAGFETGAAAIGLAQIAWRATNLVHRVFTGAESEAATLISRIKHVAGLAKIVKEVSARRRNFESSRLEASVHDMIESSLAECERSLNILDEQLRPFQDERPITHVDKIMKHSRWVRCDNIRKAQETVLESMRLDLIWCVTLLNLPDTFTSYDEYLRTARNVNQGIQQDRIPMPVQSTPRFSNVAADDPIVRAVRNNDSFTVRNLIDQDTDITLRYAQGFTLFHHAAYRLNFDALTALLISPQARNSELLDARDSLNQTALMVVAARADNPSSILVAAALLESGCDANLEDNADPHPRSALYFVINGRCSPLRITFARLLYEKGADFKSLREKLPERFEQFRVHIDPTIQRSRRRSSIAELVRTLTH